MLREKLSLQKLVAEGCLQVAEIRLMLCLMIHMVLMKIQPQVLKKCVLQLVMVVQQLQLLIRVVYYDAKVSWMLLFLLFLVEY